MTHSLSNMDARDASASKNIVYIVFFRLNLEGKWKETLEQTNYSNNAVLKNLVPWDKIK